MDNAPNNEPFAMNSILTLAELVAASCFLVTEFLTFNTTWIAG